MRVIEVFAGAGGLGVGVSKAGFSPVRIVEWDRWCCDTIRENRRLRTPAVALWPEPLEGDVRDVDFRDLAGKIDLVTGGPPCQPFSLGGKHRAHGDARDMWSEAVRVVRETRPRAFIFENVKGLTRESFASYLAYIVHQLTFPELVRRADESWEDHLGRLERHVTSRRRGAASLVYNVVYRVLNAADFGIPQRRERIVFVGFRSDLGIEWSFPQETHSLDALLWDQTRGDYWDRHETPKRAREIAPRYATRAGGLERPTPLPWRTVRDAIGDLPDPERDAREAAKIANHRFQPGARAYPGHTGSPLDEPAKTLKAGVHGVPGGENMLLSPDGGLRYFTVRESARLQTFPDDFVFHGSWSETMRQLGNAVPVELAAIVARGVREGLQANPPSLRGA
ncbi:MAG: DNA cytosine methyltransferase [Methylocystis sp.]